MSYADKALEFARKAHAGQKDKAGADYILHPIKVALYMDTDEEKAVAYLHDVLEDTDITLEDLKKCFPNEIADAVVDITKRNDESYENYIKRLSRCKTAKKVKAADLLHNLDITRIKSPSKKDFDRLEKYKKSLIYLATH